MTSPDQTPAEALRSATERARAAREGAAQAARDMATAQHNPEPSTGLPDDAPDDQVDFYRPQP